MKNKPQTLILHIDGVPVTVTRKNIKHLHLRVKQPDGSVTASAPFFMCDEAIAQFVQSKSGWIQKQVAKFACTPIPPERRYETGETLYVWGRAYILQTETGRKYALALSGDTAVLTVRRGSTVEQRTRFVTEWYRKLLMAEAAKRFPKWENVTNLRAKSWRTKMMKTRWGTCNTQKGRIWLNVRLAEKPPECLSYVILHELLHLAERKHSARFYALLTLHMPEWREVRAKLNGRKTRPNE